jgi:O-glycosyl hydrolase
MIGFGGDFCQPRYGQTDAIDRVGAYNLAHLSVAQARVGIPLNYWTPERGVYNDDSQAHAAFLLMRMLHAKGIPIIGTVWEGPTWMLPGRPEQSGRVLAPSEYGDCIEAIAKFLVTARDKYGVDVSYFSFNEANYGVNFLFAPAQIDAFIRQAGPRFAQLGLKTKFLVGDTTGGAPFADYAKPILADPAAAPYLGALAFHCWDALGASDRRYEDIADIGRATGKPIYCTEAGWDAGLWSKPDPWESWENGLRTAEAYARTMRLSGACTLDYWTYEDNYPIVSSDGAEPFPVFTVIERIQDAFPPGSRIVASRADSGDIETAASVGPKRGEFSLLIVDTSGSADLTVSGLPAGLTVRCDRLTGTGETIDPAMRVDPRGEIVLRIDPRSVVVARGSIK